MAESAEQPFFKDYWISTIHLAIKDDYERLLLTTPKRIAEKEKKEKGKKKEKKKKEKKTKKKKGKDNTKKIGQSSRWRNS